VPCVGLLDSGTSLIYGSVEQVTRLGPYIMSQQHAMCLRCMKQVDKRKITACRAHESVITTAPCQVASCIPRLRIHLHHNLTSQSATEFFAAPVSCHFTGSSRQRSSGWVALNQAAAIQLQRSGGSCAGSDC
jgi:hypothetical protein